MPGSGWAARPTRRLGWASIGSTAVGRRSRSWRSCWRGSAVTDRSVMSAASTGSRRDPLLRLARQAPRGGPGALVGKEERSGERELKRKIGELERALGRKTYELEIARLRRGRHHPAGRTSRIHKSPAYYRPIARRHGSASCAGPLALLPFEVGGDGLVGESPTARSSGSPRRRHRLRFCAGRDTTLTCRSVTVSVAASAALADGAERRFGLVETGLGEPYRARSCTITALWL